MKAIIRRARQFEGTLGVPGDKSISHRAVLFGTLAKGTTRVRGLSSGGDVQTSLGVARRLGVRVSDEGGVLLLESRGRDGWPRGAVALDAGNSGTTARLLLGMLSPVEGLVATLTGDASLSRRPMRRVANPLGLMGANLELAANGSLPALVRGARLHGHPHVLEVASAQVKTALLLAGLGADGETWVREPSTSRDHTERLLPTFGAAVTTGERGVGVRRSALEAPAQLLEIPGDPSSAAFFAVAAALVPGSRVQVTNVSLNPTRTGAFEVLRAMGARCETEATGGGGEPAGTLHAGSGTLVSTTIAGELVPRLIDELPVLAVAAALASGTTVIRDAAELRVKESDRLHLVAAGLQAMGALVEELPDGLVIHGGRPLHGAHLEAHMDHRLAMAFAVAGLVADGQTVVEGAEWADISFPGFFATLARLSGGAVEVAR